MEDTAAILQVSGESSSSAGPSSRNERGTLLSARKRALSTTSTVDIEDFMDRRKRHCPSSVSLPFNGIQLDAPLANPTVCSCTMFNSACCLNDIIQHLDRLPRSFRDIEDDARSFVETPYRRARAISRSSPRPSRPPIPALNLCLWHLPLFASIPSAQSR